ncbi:hypothetical protein KEM52_003261 [Ascosphaera acerosa]|nr:hypothetical protein KEM52_003261 [Ascosphaera acerosa]
MASIDASYLTSQVSQIVGQLHGLFDDIGVPDSERDQREAELFSALSETLQNQLLRVDGEKSELIDKANGLIQTINHMQASLDDPELTRHINSGNQELEITYPLTRCIDDLQQRLAAVSELHQQRFEEVKKLVQALESYSSHLEPTFVTIPLPPTAEGAECPPDFDLSANYVAALDAEFARVYEEYNERLSTAAVVGEDIVNLWAELGIPQEQTEATIVKYYRDSPEQLGLHESDIRALRDKREVLVAEKQGREKRLAGLKDEVRELWEKLGVEERDQRAFDAANRGLGLRVIHEYEDELARLHELKRQNLHVFVEDARCRLQELWDALLFSEEEMLEFTPAFSDVYSDALLSAHETEITRLQELQEQRAPILSLIERHKSLMEDKETLAAWSQDASRLMSRGNNGQKRDPARLLREEKMRKRIAKELPKVEADLRKLLKQWEEETGAPFLAKGQPYIDELAAAPAPSALEHHKFSIPARSKTPALTSFSRDGAARPTPSRLGNRSRDDLHIQTNLSTLRNAPSRLGGTYGTSGARTPTSATAGGPPASMTGRRMGGAPATIGVATGRTSPSKIPTPRGAQSPERSKFFPTTTKYSASTMSAATASKAAAALAEGHEHMLRLHGTGGVHPGASGGGGGGSRARGLTTPGGGGHFGGSMRMPYKPLAPPPKMRDLFSAPDPNETPKLSSTAYSFVEDPEDDPHGQSYTIGHGQGQGHAQSQGANQGQVQAQGQSRPESSDAMSFGSSAMRGNSPDDVYGSGAYDDRSGSQGSSWLTGAGSKPSSVYSSGSSVVGNGQQRRSGGSGNGGTGAGAGPGPRPKSQNAIYANNGPPILEKPGQHAGNASMLSANGGNDRYQVDGSGGARASGFPSAVSRFNNTHSSHHYSRSEEMRPDHPYQPSFNTSSTSMMSSGGHIRQISNSSSIVTGNTSCSENWETYGDGADSELEVDATDIYYAKLRNTQNRLAAAPDKGSASASGAGAGAGAGSGGAANKLPHSMTGSIRLTGGSERTRGSTGSKASNGSGSGSGRHMSIAEEEAETGAYEVGS